MIAGQRCCGVASAGRQSTAGRMSSLAQQEIYFGNTFDLITKKCDPISVIDIRQIDIYRITSYAKITPLQKSFGPGVKTFDEFVQKRVA